MTGIDIFKYEEREVRVTKDDHGEPWFVAKDVCEILEIGNTSQALSRLNESMKGITTNDTLGGVQEMITVSEAA